MSKCSYNDKLECSAEHQQLELNRQLFVAGISGAFWLMSSKPKQCKAQPHFCQRLAAFAETQQKQR